jgi:hypothetical protein
LILKGLWSSLGCPGGHDLEDKAIHNTYSTNTILSGNFSKEILTAIRTRPGVAHGLPRLSRQRPKPRNPSALSIRLGKVDRHTFNQIGHQQITTEGDLLSRAPSLAANTHSNCAHLKEASQGSR